MSKGETWLYFTTKYLPEDRGGSGIQHRYSSADIEHPFVDTEGDEEDVDEADDQEQKKSSIV